MVKLSQIAVDLTDTARLCYDEEFGIYVTVRPVPSPKFEAYLAAIQKNKPKPKAFRGEEEQEADFAESMLQGIAHTAIESIEGLENDDDSPVIYTPEWGVKTFKDPKFYQFYAWIRGECQDMGNFKRKQKAAEVGN